MLKYHIFKNSNNKLSLILFLNKKINLKQFKKLVTWYLNYKLRLLLYKFFYIIYNKIVYLSYLWKSQKLTSTINCHLSTHSYKIVITKIQQI